MVGKGRHPVLGLRSPDPLLSTVAPIGLAASVGTALVVDLVSTRAASRRTLRDMWADGPTLSELSPGRPGIAMVAGGSIERDAAIEVIEQLSRRWPALVVRTDGIDWPFATVPVIPLFPGRLAPQPEGSHGVWQPVGAGADPPGPGPVLPRLGPRALRRMLEGHLPRRSRWVEAWRPVWEMPWA